MRNRNTRQIETSSKVKREKDPLPWRYCLLTIACGALLVLGFFWAATLHFSAVDLGIRNAKLRQQKEGLEAEKRKLKLDREKALSNPEIEKAAKEIGLVKLSGNGNFEQRAISPPPEAPKAGGIVKAGDSHSAGHSLPRAKDSFRHESRPDAPSERKAEKTLRKINEKAEEAYAEGDLRFGKKGEKPEKRETGK